MVGCYEGVYYERIWDALLVSYLSTPLENELVDDDEVYRYGVYCWGYYVIDDWSV